MDGARRLIEILAELAAPAVVDQRVERRVVGEGPAGKAGQRDRAGTMRKKSAPIDTLAAAFTHGLSHGAVPWRVDLACHRHAAKGSLSRPCRPTLLATASGRQIYGRKRYIETERMAALIAWMLVVRVGSYPCDRGRFLGPS